MSKNIHHGYVNNLFKNQSFLISDINYFFIEHNYGFLLNIDRDINILEFGPGKGFVIDFLLINGFKNVTLCEIDQENCDALKEKYKSFENIKIINDDVVNFLNSNTLKFDLIMSFQVIEHISKGALVDLFDSAARGLENDGLFLSETINSQNLIYGNYYNYIDFTHRTSFTPKSLRELARSSFNKADFGDYKHPSIFKLIKFYLRDKKIMNKNIQRFNKTIGLELDKNIIGGGIQKGFVSRLIDYIKKYHYWKKSINFSRKYLNFVEEKYFSHFIIMTNRK